MSVKNLEKKAQRFATEAHAGQFRKDGKTPYITHCARVVDLLSGIGIKDENVLAAAWLHDVIEDCGVSNEKIEEEFNAEVARIVYALTRNVDRDAYKERIKNANYAVQIIKLADMVHNCSELNICLPYKTVNRKLRDSERFYLDLARNICPKFYELLNKHVQNLMSYDN